MAGDEDAGYVCTLDDAALKVAREELHEDPKERLSQVAAFRQWILSQPHLKCPTDTGYLLRFLRYAKFSQLRSREAIEGFLGMKTEFPEWFTNIDLTKPCVEKLLKTGYMIPLPKRDPKGRKVILYRFGAFTPDPKEFDRADIMATVFALYMQLLREAEQTTVCGVVMLADFGSFTVKHQTFLGMDYMRKSTKCWQKNHPGRFKAFHYYNTGPVFEAIMSIIKPLLQKKFQDRINLHGNNMESVYKVIPMECLPREYLPDEYTGPHAGTMAELIANTVNWAKDPAVVARTLHETDPQWGNEKKLKLDMPNESFRKLAVVE